MNLEFFKGLAENARKVKWGKTAQFNGRDVTVTDVDLNAKAAFDKPMTATVKFTENGTTREIVGVFWPRDMRPESVELDSTEQPGGKVGFSGKPKWFPPGVTLKLRFRWEGNNEFVVTGKVGVSLGLDILGLE